MVNTGKPSGACKLCRSRRIKCDETKPGCRRCLKSKIECPGYRDPFEAKIKDETQTTIKKCRLSQQRQCAAREKSTSPTRSNSWKVSGGGGGLGGGLGVVGVGVGGGGGGGGGSYFHDHTSQAAVSFMQDFAASLFMPAAAQESSSLWTADLGLGPTASSRSRGNFVHSLMKRPTVLSCLDSAFKAVSYASLSRRSDCEPLILTAQMFYALALSETQLAIQDPFKVRDDQTLAAVLLMAFYESLNCGQGQLNEYVSHIKGAAHLIKIRGSAQFETPEGHEMSALVRRALLALRQSPGGSDDESDSSSYSPTYSPI